MVKKGQQKMEFHKSERKYVSETSFLGKEEDTLLKVHAHSLNIK